SLCSPEEQRLWARLSVFAGSCALEAVEQVCFDDPAPGEIPIDTLSPLIDQSIVIREESDYGVRVRMLAFVAEDGRAQYSECGAKPSLRRRHRAWYERLAARAAADWISDRQSAWNAELERELPNLRAALDSFLSEDTPEAAEAALAVISALSEFWTFRGLHGEGRAWADRALVHPGMRSVPCRVQGLCISAHFTAAQGDFDGATDRLRLVRSYPEGDM